MANPLDDLATQVAALEVRVSALEGWRSEHEAGMILREQQITHVQQVANRDRFLSTLRRGHR